MIRSLPLAVLTLHSHFELHPGETLKWNNLVSYALIVGAVFFSFGF